MQTPLNFVKYTKQEAKLKGLPTFNDCNHYVVDMSHLDPRNKEDWMNTIVVKLPNGNSLTLCVMQTGKIESNIDCAFHGDNIKEHRVYGLGGEGQDVNVCNKNIYALIAQAKEEK